MLTSLKTKRKIIPSILIFAFIILLLEGCVEMYGKPEDRAAQNRALSDYMLCEKLAVANLAPPEIRNEWAMELQHRGVNCSQYANALNTAVQQNQELLETGAKLLKPQQQYQTQPQPYGGGVARGTAIYKREYVSGHNKICIYDRLGSEVAITIGAANICSLSIP